MVVDEVEELDAAAALLAFGDLREARDRAERDILLLAAHYADLHHPDSTPRGARTLPGNPQTTYMAGGYGLQSTAHDYLMFETMLLNEGTIHGRRVLRPARCRLRPRRYHQRRARFAPVPRPAP